MVREDSENRHPATAIVSRVEESHQRIRNDLEALDKCDDVAEIRAIVDELPDLLKEHFRDEEKPGGLFDELEALSPVFDSQLKFLRQEHREIMQALEGLRQQFREADEVSQDAELEPRYDHIRVSTTAFLELIHHHERIESRLVADTFYSENGGSG